MSLLTNRPVSELRIQDDLARFQTAPTTLFFDRFMTHFIKVGGIGIIAAVLGIFIFIFSQTLPLFQSAKVHPVKTIPLEKHSYLALGADGWGELPFLVEDSGKIRFVRTEDGTTEKIVDPAGEFSKNVTAVFYNTRAQQLIYGTSDGYFFSTDIQYEPAYRNGKRTIGAEIATHPLQEASIPGLPVLQLAQGGQGEKQLMVSVQEAGGRRMVWAVLFTKTQTLFGSGELERHSQYDLTPMISGYPEKVLVNSNGDSVIVSTHEGQVHYFRIQNGQVSLEQVFTPFEDVSSPAISSINFLFGEVSLVMTNPEGDNRIYSLYIPEGTSTRVFGLTKNFEALPGGANFYNASLRNKAFLIGSGQTVSVRYGTTETIRWQEKFPFKVQQGVLGRKYNSILLLDDESRLHFYNLNDPHPEAGWKTFMGKIWYEGYSKPEYAWQSTGGTDDFESKLSLVPLILGTLKGTLYALLFALPIALLAAIYTSQFAHPRFKNLVKPLMEIMASLPSVVLGFLAALWLAPIIETKVPTFLLAIVFIPALVFSFGYFWTSLPIQYRRWIPAGYEWIVLFPILFAGTILCAQLGPIVEKLFFVVTDPHTGQKIADFRLWWPTVTGTPFEQRNSLVVGFMMGFAVIPIIFTIAEDSLSNVPKTLVSGSLALGASRWQTALHVVVPTAYPGIFSAVMIGLGRAVGETMIVVMATGNTPIMDFNIFSGMRTLSANIAVELPEAPYLGTLYRTLFLGSVVLFLMTFIVNTIAEIIRQHLREKYRTV